MVDGTLTIKLDEYGRKKLAEKARKLGLTPEAIVEDILGNALFDYNDFAWPQGGDPREDHASNYDLEEEGRPWSEVRAEFLALTEKAFGDRA